MMLRPSLTLAWILLLMVSFLALATNATRTKIGMITEKKIDESSGIDLSRRHPDVLYLVNDDEENEPKEAILYAFNAKDASLLATFHIKNAKQCDWEDLAVGAGPGNDSYIYIGDVGGNRPGRVCTTIYRIREPNVIQDGELDIDAKVTYSWNEKNCETLMVDGQGIVYLVSKVHPPGPPKLYHVPNGAWSQSTKVALQGGTNVAGFFKRCVGRECYGATAGDISASGDHVLIKEYNTLYHWRNNDSVDVGTLLQRQPRVIDYIKEEQGETVCWDAKDQGFYTHGEGGNQPLWYYAQLADAPPYVPPPAGSEAVTIHHNSRKNSNKVIMTLWLIYFFK